MTALATERKTPMVGGGPLPNFATTAGIGLAASTKIYEGSLVGMDASGYAIPATSTCTAVLGVAEATVDNSSGIAGAKTIVPRVGVFRFNNSSSTDAITIAERGAYIWVVDDNIVAKTNNGGTRTVQAGIVYDVDANGVWVMVNPAVGVRQEAAEYLGESTYFHVADATAATAFTEFPICNIPRAATITSITIMASAAITASDADYATLTFGIRNGTGGAASQLWTGTTKVTGGTGTISAFTRYSFTTLTNTTAAANSVIMLTTAKAGSGVTIPRSIITVKYTAA